MRCTYHEGLLILTYHRGLLIWYAFWNFSNLSWRVAYLKLSDETWNVICYLKLLKLIKPIMEGGLFETFWNFSNLSWRVPYLKLSDDIWNEMCYLKLLKLLKPIMEGCLFETFRWHLKWDVLFETFETSQTYHGGWLIWIFQMRLEMRCTIWNFSNLSSRVAYLKLFETFQTYHEGLLILNFQMRLEMWYAIWNLSNLSWRVAYLKLFETFQTYLGGFLILNFQMTFEMRCAIWNFWNFSNLSWRVAYLKLSDETWNEMCYLKLLKLLKPIMEGCLFETFRWDLKSDVLFQTF